MEQIKELIKAIRKRYNDRNNTRKYLRIISRDTTHYVIQGENFKRIEVYDIPKYDEVRVRPSRAIISLKERCFARRGMIDSDILQRDWAIKVFQEDKEWIERYNYEIKEKKKKLSSIIC